MFFTFLISLSIDIQMSLTFLFTDACLVSVTGRWNAECDLEGTTFRSDLPCLDYIGETTRQLLT